MCPGYFPPHHWLPLSKWICLVSESLGCKTCLSVLGFASSQRPWQLKGVPPTVCMHLLVYMHACVYACTWVYLCMCWLWSQEEWRQNGPGRAGCLVRPKPPPVAPAQGHLRAGAQWLQERLMPGAPDGTAASLLVAALSGPLVRWLGLQGCGALPGAQHACFLLHKLLQHLQLPISHCPTQRGPLINHLSCR